MIRLAIISDTHKGTFEELPASLIERLKGADAIVHLGDYTGKAVVDGLRELGTFYGVAGNMDSAAVKAELPERLVVELGGRRIGLIHGFGTPVKLGGRVKAYFKDVDAILYGHSHMPRIDIVEGVFCLNPGSAGGRFPAEHKTMASVAIGKTIKGEIVELN